MKSLIVRRISYAFVAAAMLGSAAVPALAHGGIYIGIAPPAPVYEPVPVAPYPGQAWRAGYWAWNGYRYVWVHGGYAPLPYAGAIWVPGGWGYFHGGWGWHGGHWRR